MSSIEINATNIKKFSKRLQKHSESFGYKATLSESQEFLAKILGKNTYNELLKIVSPSNEDHSIEDESDLSIELKNQTESFVDLESEQFVSSLKNIVNLSDSNIVFCYFSKKDIATYDIVFKSCYGDEYVYRFGKKDLNIGINQITEFGISAVDAARLHGVFHEHFNAFKNRFDSIDFASRLYKYFQMTTGHTLMAYCFKLDVNHELLKNIILVNDTLYERDYIYVTPQIFKEMNSLSINSKYSYLLNPQFEINYNSSQRYDPDLVKFVFYKEFLNTRSKNFIFENSNK